MKCDCQSASGKKTTSINLGKSNHLTFEDITTLFLKLVTNMTKIPSLAMTMVTCGALAIDVGHTLSLPHYCEFAEPEANLLQIAAQVACCSGSSICCNTDTCVRSLEYCLQSVPQNEPGATAGHIAGTDFSYPFNMSSALCVLMCVIRSLLYSLLNCPYSRGREFAVQGHEPATQGQVRGAQRGRWLWLAVQGHEWHVGDRLLGTRRWTFRCQGLDTECTLLRAPMHCLRVPRWAVWIHFLHHVFWMTIGRRQ